jgi:hypothetical protein
MSRRTLILAVLLCSTFSAQAQASTEWNSLRQTATVPCLYACPVPEGLIVISTESAVAYFACLPTPPIPPGSFADARLEAPNGTVGMRVSAYEGEWQTVVCKVDQGGRWSVSDWARQYGQCIYPPGTYLTPRPCHREAFVTATAGDVFVIRSFNKFDISAPIEQVVEWRWCIVPCPGPIAYE